MKMFYYLYQITNNLNGKIYVGVHKTKDMNDGYMGSGKIIRSAITKHGISNFSKVILETFENAEAMYAREKEVVNEEFLLREDTYNIRRGGTGG
jgi:dissimilatory sulfite reductase (desulfoviridin) alpha/beta subunit